MAVETLVNITQDEIEYERMSNLIKSQLDYQSDMVNAKREGRAEGLAEGMEKGREEGMEEAARNALAQGASLDFVQKITGLDIQTIAGFQEKR